MSFSLHSACDKRQVALQIIRFASAFEPVSMLPLSSTLESFRREDAALVCPTLTSKLLSAVCISEYFEKRTELETSGSLGFSPQKK
ncbi:MAG: hypothetical protein AABW85_02920 [archaeon]